MKVSEIQPGKTYWYDTNNNWDGGSPHATYHCYAVRIDSVDRYTYADKGYGFDRRTPDQRAHKNAKGTHLRGIVPSKDGEDDRIVYVMPRYLRAEYDEAVKIMQAREDARKAQYAETERQSAEAARRAEALRARLEALGIDGIEIYSTSASTFRRTVPNVEVKLSQPEKTLGALLDRLEAAEGRDAA